MAGQIIPRGKSTWLVRVYLGRDPETGKRQYHNKTVHGTKKEAQNYLTQTLRERDMGILTAGGEKRTVSGLLDDLLLDYKVNGKDHKWATIIVEKHLRPAFGELAISRLNTDHVKRYIHKRRQAGRANATINNELALLRHSLYMGAKCTPPKVHRVIHIPKLEATNVRKGFFEHTDFAAARAALPEEVRPVSTFAYYTGCRRGEILFLQWPQVDLMERSIRLEPGTTKSGEARVIPLTGELYEVLKMQRAIRDEKYPDCPWVFFRYDTGARIKYFRRSWATACKQAKLWDGESNKAAKLFHDLRRTGVRNLIRAGVPERVAMAISGHKTRSVFDRYNIVSESDLKDAMRRLDSYIQERANSETRPGTQSAGWHTIGTQKPGSVN